MGPRLGSRGKRSRRDRLPRLGPLQWGRDLEVAESFLSDQCDDNRLIASMGPRLGSRGKFARRTEQRSWKQPLQWGRDLEVAERNRPLPRGNYA